MTTAWDRGVKILNGLEPHYAKERDRILDIGVARALGVQFRSGYNILRFYLLREEMLRMEGKERLDILNQLSDIIREELDLDEQLLKLCERDSRLGFHSEAEGYKYFPEKIRWRMRQLKSVLASDVPEMGKIIRDGGFLFPEYTGKKPSGAVAYAVPSDGSLWSNLKGDYSKDLKWQSCDFGPHKPVVRWAATYDKEALYIVVAGISDPAHPSSVASISNVLLKIEPHRLFPCRRFVFNPGAEKLVDNVRVLKESGISRAVVRIPFDRIGLTAEDFQPIRIDVRVQTRKEGSSAWRPNNPATSRLSLGSDNPADLGWLVFRK
jgi:hypothetical protein